MVFTQRTDDGDIIFKSDNGSGGTTNYFKIQGGSEQTVFNKKVKLEDSVELRFGNGNDMRLHHNGSNNSIESYSGNLRLIQNKSRPVPKVNLLSSGKVTTPSLPSKKKYVSVPPEPS